MLSHENFNLIRLLGKKLQNKLKLTTVSLPKILGKPDKLELHLRMQQRAIFSNLAKQKILSSHDLTANLFLPRWKAQGAVLVIPILQILLLSNDTRAGPL